VRVGFSGNTPRRAGLLITNVSQLLALRARAADGYRAKIEGVVAGSLDQAGLYVMDVSDCLELHEFRRRQPVQNRAGGSCRRREQLAEDQVGLTQVQFRAYRECARSARRISLEQLMPPAKI